MSARLEDWRLDEDAHEDDPAYRAVKAEIHARDDHVCAYCGFRSRRFQECHHLSGDHRDNRPGNLATVCAFCHMVFHVGRTGGKGGEALLVWYPEISQTMLHHMARAAYIAIRFAGPSLREAARNFLAAMRERSEVLPERIGTCDPTLLGEALLRLPPADYQRRGEMLKEVRLFPLGRYYAGGRDRFTDMLEYWVSPEGPYAEVPPERWREFYDGILRVR